MPPPPLELVRALSARAGLRLDTPELEAVAAVLATHAEALAVLRALELPPDEAAFTAAWG